MAKFGAKEFGAETQAVYNNSTATISKGDAVSWGSTVTALENPTMDPGSTATTLPVLGVKTGAAAFEENFLGVALADITDTTWGYIAINGYCDATVAKSQALTAGDLLTVSAGEMKEAADATANSFHAAIALEACVTTTATGTCAVRISSMPGMGNVGA